jgi:hypothetical protein
MLMITLINTHINFHIINNDKICCQFGFRRKWLFLEIMLNLIVKIGLNFNIMYRIN